MTFKPYAFTEYESYSNVTRDPVNARAPLGSCCRQKLHHQHLEIRGQALGLESLIELNEEGDICVCQDVISEMLQVRETCPEGRWIIPNLLHWSRCTVIRGGNMCCQNSKSTGTVAI